MLGIIVALLFVPLFVAAVCIALDAIRAPRAALERAARIDAARATAPAHFVPVRRIKCPVCDYPLPPQGPCPECAHEPLQLPLSPDASARLARALDTLAAQHRRHALALLVVIPASLVPPLVRSPFAALAAIPPAWVILHALATLARPDAERTIPYRTTQSFVLAMLAALALTICTAAIPLIPPSIARIQSILAAPNPVSFLPFIAVQILFLIAAAQFQLTTIEALRSVPHKPTLAPRAMIPFALALALIVPGLFFLGLFWLAIGPLALLVLATTDRALVRELDVWADSARAARAP